MDRSLDHITRIYREACKLKDMAYRTPENIDIYLEAAKHFHESGEMTLKIMGMPGEVEEENIHKRILANYYFYEEQECLKNFYSAGGRPEKARDHCCKGEKYITNAIGLVKFSMDYVDEKLKQKYRNYLIKWELNKISLGLSRMAIEAKTAWDKGNYLEAQALYKKMNAFYKNAVRCIETYQPDPVNKTALKGDYAVLVANMSNTAAHMTLSKEKKGKNGMVSVPFSIAVEFLKNIFRLHKKLIGEFADDNGRDGSSCGDRIFLENIKLFLKHNVSKWADIYAAFENEPDFLEIMKSVDRYEYKKVEEKFGMNNNKLLKLWFAGFFWIFIFSVIGSLCLFIANIRFTWWKMLLVISSMEVFIVTIGAFLLRTTGDLTEKGFLDLLSAALLYQFRFFGLWRNYIRSKRGK